MVLSLPIVIVTEPRALKNPLAVATTETVPDETSIAKLPSELTVADPTSVLFTSYALIVTGLDANTVPSRPPAFAGVDVADGSGVNVNIDVGVSKGVGVNVSVAVGVGEEPGVAVGSVSHVYVATI